MSIDIDDDVPPTGPYVVLSQDIIHLDDDCFQPLASSGGVSEKL